MNNTQHVTPAAGHVVALSAIAFTRSTRKLAEKCINDNRDILGASSHWYDGQWFPQFVEWTPVRRADGKWNIVTTVTIDFSELAA